MSSVMSIGGRLGRAGRGLARRASAVIFPPQCLLCGDLVAGQGGLCGPCWRDTPMILGPVCRLCGVPVLSGDAAPAETGAVCNACGAAGRPWDWGRSVMLYSGGARRLVLGLKHGDRLDLVPGLAVWMAARLAGAEMRDAVVVPVPAHRWRLFRRRYNQAAVLANALARNLGADACPDALRRTRATAPQRGREEAARRRNVADAIAVAPARAARLAGARVILVDDVMTSGATLEACATALRAAGAREIGVVVLARAARDDYIASGEDNEDEHDAAG